MLSIKCENCGANISFEQDHIPGFCSFCGSSMSITKDMLEKLIDAEENARNRELERDRMAHEKKVQRSRTIRMFFKLLPIILVLLFLFYSTYAILRM